MSYPLVHLDEITKLVTKGTTPTTVGMPFTKEGIPFIRVNNIQSKILNFQDDVLYIDKLTHQKLSRSIIEPKDILLSIAGSIGRTCVVPSNAPELNCNQAVCIIKCDTNIVLPEYLSYWFQSSIAINQITNSKVTGVIQNLSLTQVKSLNILLPPLEEQRRIADILDKADSLIQKRKASIAKLNELLQATFIDMFGDPVTNPKGWKVKLLQDLSIKIHSGNTPKGGAENYVETGIIFLRSQNVWKNKVVLDDVAYIDEETHAKMSKSSVKHEDILMTKTGRINTENSSLGRAAIYQGSDDSANINGHVYLIRIKEGFSKYFILSILTQPDYYEYIRSICVGGIDKRQLNKEHLEKLPIIFPPQESQARFEKIMKAIGKQKQAMQVQLEAQETLFKALQQQAFSGQL